MDITRENTDALNAVVKVDIIADDYQPKVDKILVDYRKKQIFLVLEKVMCLWE